MVLDGMGVHNKMKHKYYLVDDVVLRVPAEKDMTGYQEVAYYKDDKAEPYSPLVELYLKAKRGKRK